MVSEAHKRATKKYKEKVKIKNWQVDLKPEDFEKIEAERTRRNLSRKEFLESLSKEK